MSLMTRSTPSLSCMSSRVACSTSGSLELASTPAARLVTIVDSTSVGEVARLTIAAKVVRSGSTSSSTSNCSAAPT